MAEKRKLAFYIRLSDADEEVKEGTKDESNSITGQRKLLYAYIKKTEEFAGFEVLEYFDDGLDCQHFFRQIFLGYFSDIVQAFDTLRKNVCGDDYTSLHNPIVLSSVLPAYGMFHSIQILFL